MSQDRTTQILEQQQEPFTGFGTTISSDHAYIHKGIAFTGIVDLGSISVATRIGFTTPTVESGLFVHWRPISVQSSADYVKIVLTEDDSFSAGTAQTPINRNRNSANISDMQAFAKGVTATPVGTEIQIGGIGVSGNAASKAGGGGGADEEIVLVPDTSYVLTLTPDGATTVTLELFWYEEDKGI